MLLVLVLEYNECVVAVAVVVQYGCSRWLRTENRERKKMQFLTVKLWRGQSCIFSGHLIVFMLQFSIPLSFLLFIAMNSLAKKYHV